MFFLSGGFYDFDSFLCGILFLHNHVLFIFHQVVRPALCTSGNFKTNECQSIFLNRFFAKILEVFNII